VLGVDLFFVLSGFLITGLLLDSKGSAGYFRNFYARRTLRIFPLYYFVLALLFVVLPRLTALPPPLEEARSHQGWLWTYGTNFFIATKGSWALTYVSHFWSLAIEEHFYLLWPLIVFSVRRAILERICLCIIGAALALRIGLTVGGFNELSISVLTPCRVDTLCVGALLAAMARREAGPAPLVQGSTRAAVVLAAISVALGAWCATTHLGLAVLHPVRTTLYAMFFGALTLMSVQDQAHSLVARFFHASWLRTLGKYSYGVYVYHGILAQHMHQVQVQERLATLLGGHARGMVAYAVVGVCVSLLVAVLSYELFEKRFLAAKRFFESRRTHAAGPQTGHGPAEHAGTAARTLPALLE